MHDLVIRGATVVDGLGRDPVRADIGVKDGRIAAIGNLGKDAAEIVDAGGLALMPGGTRSTCCSISASRRTSILG
jgi:N-acyl-D-amino-acid deacylase